MIQSNYKAKFHQVGKHGTLTRVGRKVHRNELCPCGKEVEISYNGGVFVHKKRFKFKNCCLSHRG